MPAINREPAQSREIKASWIDLTLEIGVRWLLALLLFAPIAFMGGPYEWGWLAWGQSAFVGTIALAALLWLLRLALRPQLGLVFTWSLLALAMGGLVGVLQLAALPAGLLRFCSPGLETHLPLWSPDGAETLGSWTCASLVPSRTAESLHYFGLYCLTFFLVVQNVRTLSAVRQLLLAVFFLGIATALCGFGHYLLWNEQFYGFFEIPWVPKANFMRAPFTNKNHFSGYLAMTVGPGCYWLLRVLGLFSEARPRSKRSRGGRGSDAPMPSGKKFDFLMPIGCFTLGCVLVASFLSVSRGGIIATTLAFVVAVGGLTFYIRSRRLWLFIALLTCLIFAGIMGFVGTEKIQERFTAFGTDSDSGGTSDGRLELWLALLKSVPDFPVLGTGFGTHQYVYQLFLDKKTDVVYTHAENCYLQLLTEGGLATVLVVVLAMGCLGFWCVRGLRGTTCPDARPCMVAIMAALAATAFHGLVDFVWYLPSHALLIAVLAGLACAVARLQNPNARVLPLPSAPRCWVGVAGVYGTILFASWLQTSYHHAQANLLWTEFQLGPDGGFAAEDAPKTGDGSLLLAALQEKPDQPVYHAALGDLALQRFFQSKEWTAMPMPLGQLADAVRGSHFDSPLKRDRWLDNVYGSDNRKLLQSASAHYRHAVQHYPLEARAYLRLAELRDLVEQGPIPARTLLAQGLQADPYNPETCYQAGSVYLQLEDIVETMACWRRSARSSERHKQAILAQLAAAVPLPQLVEHFQPDYGSLLSLARANFTGPDLRPSRLYLLNQARELTLKETDAKIVGAHMRELHHAFQKEEAPELAGKCARTAARAEPYVLSTRLMLARTLIQLGQFKDAKTELEWCAAREPTNPDVRVLRSAVFDGLNASRRSPEPAPVPVQKGSPTAQVDGH